MQLHQVRPLHKLRKARRVGRGGKKGTTAGRGTKGQKARAGAKIRPAERDLIKKLPQLRGVYFKSFKIKPAAVNLDLIDKKFSEDQKVNPQTLLALGLVRRARGKVPSVKILGNGKLSKKLAFSQVTFSEVAKEKIIKSGSTIR